MKPVGTTDIRQVRAQAELVEKAAKRAEARTGVWRAIAALMSLVFFVALACAPPVVIWVWETLL